MKITFKYLQDFPILDVCDHPALGGNINGPSLIRVPHWVANPLGRYYLYFAHHEGWQIQLAVADSLAGPWQVFDPGVLSLKNSLFCQHAPAAADTSVEVLASIAAGIDGDYPHVASPDVHCDAERQNIRMYYHGRNADGTQQTRLAESVDGIAFTPLPPLLGDSYFRVFEFRDYHYAIALGGKLYRSSDGGSSFEAGPVLTNEGYRHGAVLQMVGSDAIHVIWSRGGDCPEALLLSPLLTTAMADTTDSESGPAVDWWQWRLGASTLLHKPESAWEGADEPLEPSRFGGTMKSVNQLRDPAVFHEDGRVYLLYSIRGEQGIAIAEMTY